MERESERIADTKDEEDEEDQEQELELRGSGESGGHQSRTLDRPRLFLSGV